VDTFKMTKSQRRVWNKGAQFFKATVGSCHFSEEKAEVYRRYLAHQHGTEEESVTEERYSTFLVESCLHHETMEIQYRVGDRLAGVGIVDRLRHSLSTVYFYFDPDFARLSPGTWSALFEIQLARAWGLQHYYLGYYIPGCDAMNYKSRFQPCELKQPDTPGWIPFMPERFSV
jgi:arginine-tRNA-protein transferase